MKSAWFGLLYVMLPAQHAGHAPAPPPAVAPAVAKDGGPPPVVEVSLAEDEIRAIGLRTETPRMEDFARNIRAVAVVSVDERRVAHIHTRFSGYIEKLHANYIGQRVRKGQALVEIFSPDVLAAQSEWVTALGQVDEARRRGAAAPELKSRMALADAARKRLTLWDITPGLLDGVERTRTPRRTVTLYSPLQGTVTVKDAVLGLYVGPDVHLFEVADLRRVWVVGDVYPHELDDIRVGSRASFLPDASSQARVGEVEFIAPMVQAATRTVGIRVTFDNVDGRLKPGVYGTLTVEAAGRPGVAIPDQAVVQTGNRAMVFVQLAPGRFVAREVVLGRRVPGLVEVKSGLEVSEPVVVAAQFVLDAESQLRSRGGAGGHGGH